MNSTSDRVLWTGASEKLGIDFHQNIINSVELVEQEDINKSSTVTVLNNDDNLLPDIVSSIDFSKPRTADEFLQLFSSLASDKSDGNEVPEVSSSTPSEVINIKSNQDSHMKPTLNTSSTLQQTVSKILQSSELNIPNSLPPPRYINTDITYTGSAFGLSTSKESTTSSSSSSSSALKIEESLPCSPLCAWYLNDGMPNFSKYSSSSVSLKQMQSMERNQLLRNISSLKVCINIIHM